MPTTTNNKNHRTTKNDTQIAFAIDQQPGGLWLQGKYRTINDAGDFKAKGEEERIEMRRIYIYIECIFRMANVIHKFCAKCWQKYFTETALVLLLLV